MAATSADGVVGSSPRAPSAFACAGPGAAALAGRGGKIALRRGRSVMLTTSARASRRTSPCRWRRRSPCVRSGTRPVETMPGTIVAVPGPPWVRMKIDVKFWMVQIMLRTRMSLHLPGHQRKFDAAETAPAAPRRRWLRRRGSRAECSRQDGPRKMSSAKPSTQGKPIHQGVEGDVGIAQPRLAAKRCQRHQELVEQPEVGVVEDFQIR